MFMWQICLAIEIGMLPIALVLKVITDSILNNRVLKWRRDQVKLMKMIMKKNKLIFILLCIEGIISNIALLVLIISIPIYFIWHI